MDIYIMDVITNLYIFYWTHLLFFGISIADDRTCFQTLSNSSAVLSKRLDGFTIRRYTDIGIQQCWTFCGMLPDCMSVSYRKQRLLCFLSNTNVMLQPGAMKNTKVFNYYTVRKNKVEGYPCGEHSCKHTESCIVLKNGKSICVKSDLQCPGEGYYFNGFLKFCVRLSSAVRSYREANQNCLGEGARLLRLNGKTKKTEVSTWLSRIGNRSIDSIWIMGKSDPGQPFVYHNGKSLPYKNWANGQPITGVSYKQGVVISVTSSYKWKSLDASEQHFYICEKIMKGSNLF